MTVATRRFRRLLYAAVTIAGILGASAMLRAQRAGAAFPPRLENYLTSSVRLTAADRRALLGGAPVTKLLEGDASKEVAVFGAIWINAPVHRYVEAVEDIETFERGAAFKVTRRISSPPGIEDFADLHLPPKDVADLRTCRVGDCEVKLSERALHRFQTEVDWRAPNAREAVDALMRQLALEYVTGYLEGGNERLAVYRDTSAPTDVAGEFRAMLEGMPALASDMPALRNYLLSYPRATLPDSTSFLYWQETEFGLKPTIRISHLTIHEGADETIVASKMLYASHYFWSGLELRALIPDPSRGDGFWLVTISRSRSDGLSGFTGMFVRRRVRTEVRQGTLTSLQATKRKLEQAR